MSNSFVKLQTQVLKAIGRSPLTNSEIGLLWSDRYGGKSRNLSQCVGQWQSSGLPQSIASLVQLLDVLGYCVKIEKRAKEEHK